MGIESVVGTMVGKTQGTDLGGAAAAIAQKMAEIEARVDWLKCPWCSQEWIRLYHGICVDCNRDVRGFLRAQRRVPISGMKIEIEIKPWARAVEKEIRDTVPECFIAIFTIGMHKFFADCNVDLTLPIHLWSEVEGENASHQDDGTGRDKLRNWHLSVADAWSALRKFMDPNGLDPVDDEPPPF